MTLREQVLHDALALAPEDRVFVLDELEHSLNKGGFASPEIAAAWAREIERRERRSTAEKCPLTTRMSYCRVCDAFSLSTRPGKNNRDRQAPRDCRGRSHRSLALL